MCALRNRSPTDRLSQIINVMAQLTVIARAEANRPSNPFYSCVPTSELQKVGT